MKTLAETIGELDDMRHGSAREVVQKLVEALSEIDRRFSLLEQTQGSPHGASVDGVSRSFY
jgi:hypothetical protein